MLFQLLFLYQLAVQLMKKNRRVQVSCLPKAQEIMMYWFGQMNLILMVCPVMKIGHMMLEKVKEVGEITKFNFIREIKMPMLRMVF